MPLSARPFAASSPWNTLLGSNPTYSPLNWPATTGYNYTVNWSSYSPAVYIAVSGDPLVVVTYPAGWGYPGGTINVHMPIGADGASGTDGELLVIDGTEVYNFWVFSRTSNTTATCQAMAHCDINGSGFGSPNPFLAAGINAIGASELGGLLSEYDRTSGSINHALQLVTDYAITQAGFVPPAISGDGSGAAGSIVKEGQLLAIPKTTPMPQFSYDGSTPLSALGQQVFTAMKLYGAYDSDVAGGDSAIRVQQNGGFDQASMDALWHDMNVIIPLLQLVTDPGVSGGSTTPVTSRFRASFEAIKNVKPTRRLAVEKISPVKVATPARAESGSDPLGTTVTTKFPASFESVENVKTTRRSLFETGPIGPTVVIASFRGWIEAIRSTKPAQVGSVSFEKVSNVKPALPARMAAGYLGTLTAVTSRFTGWFETVGNVEPASSASGEAVTNVSPKPPAGVEIGPAVIIASFRGRVEATSADSAKIGAPLENVLIVKPKLPSFVESNYFGTLTAVTTKFAGWLEGLGNVEPAEPVVGESVAGLKPAIPVRVEAGSSASGTAVTARFAAWFESLGVVRPKPPIAVGSWANILGTQVTTTFPVSVETIGIVSAAGTVASESDTTEPTAAVPPSFVNVEALDRPILIATASDTLAQSAAPPSGFVET